LRAYKLSRLAKPTNIRTGRANTPAPISPLLFQKTDIMSYSGQSHTVEAIRFLEVFPTLVRPPWGDENLQPFLGLH
jgi:hypothetical protein